MMDSVVGDFFNALFKHYPDILSEVFIKSKDYMGPAIWKKLKCWHIFLAVRHLRNLEVADAKLSAICVLPLVLFSWVKFGHHKGYLELRRRDQLDLAFLDVVYLLASVLQLLLQLWRKGFLINNCHFIFSAQKN